VLKGKTALVTGATSGIGPGIAEAFARDGVNLIVNGFGEAAEIERQRARLADTYRVKVKYDGADMSKADASEAMMSSAIAEFGAMDVLVNNAGILHIAPVDELPPAKWDAILAIEELAALTLFLASDGATSITGAVIPIEGGWTAH
jgi:3-hydroxybutyrate dehydrogenase